MTWMVTMTDRYQVIAAAPEWLVVDTLPHLMEGMSPEIVNRYTKDAKDRADEVAADMNRHDIKKRGVLVLTEDDIVKEVD